MHVLFKWPSALEWRSCVLGFSLMSCRVVYALLLCRNGGLSACRCRHALGCLLVKFRFKKKKKKLSSGFVLAISWERTSGCLRCESPAIGFRRFGFLRQPSLSPSLPKTSSSSIGENIPRESTPGLPLSKSTLPGMPYPRIYAHR